MELEEIAGQLMALTHLCAALTAHHSRRTELLWLLDAHAEEVKRSDAPRFANGYARVVALVSQAVSEAGGPGRTDPLR